MEHVLDFNADLVFLCELWLKTDNNAVTAKIKDYNYLILHNIRKSSTKNRGGGVGLLYSNRLQVKKDRSVKGFYLNKVVDCDKQLKKHCLTDHI